MAYQQEKWRVLDRKQMLDCRVFTVNQQRARSPEGREGDFYVLDSADWAMVIPVQKNAQGEEEIVMVRQYRHGLDDVTIEFPGGIVEPGEDPGKAVLRELEEETGRRAKKLTKLGEVSPNPAIMSNRFHVYLAEDLEDSGTQSLDPDEELRIQVISKAELLREYGLAPYNHALTLVSVAFWLKARPV
jgi:8-oxo-dGTP pyrophosphatase MutT (NUDIX family)